MQKIQTINPLPVDTPKRSETRPQGSGRNAQMCDSCGGIRWFSYSNLELGHPFYGRLFPCPECNMETIDRACGLQDHERAITLDGIVTDGLPGTLRVVTAARRFVENPIGFLSIHGNYGNAKTTTLMGIVNELLSRSIEARYITAADLLAYLRDAFKDGNKDSDYDRLHSLAVVPVLCIDEMDKFRNSEYSREIQQEIINLRYRNARFLGTVMAWNGGIDDLPFPAIVSRAREFAVIHNTDPDMRPLIGGNND